MASIFMTEDGSVRGGWRAVGFLLLSVLVVTALIAASRELPEDVAFWLPEVYLSALGVLSVTWLFTRRERRPLAAVGLELSPRALRQFGTGMGYGAGLVLVTAVLVVAVGALHFEIAPQVSTLDIVKTGLFMFGAVLFEETLFRGYAFQRAVEGIGRRWALAVFAIIFLLAHPMDESMPPELMTIASANLLLAAVLLGQCMLRSGGLALPIGLHLGWNWMLQTLGFSISGKLAFDSIWNPVFDTSDQWLTGGPYGLEASALSLPVLLAAVAWFSRGTPAVQSQP
ncbi:MAG TPA: type II CAAX endopeptidase family protein [Telluria sp.]|nr:type II CAAX endopeptidase family protein [Telluria sp.]